MKSVRVVLAIVALLALPFGSVAAQSRGKGGKGSPVRSAEVASDCKDQQAAALARAQADGHSPYGLDKKCSDPVPPPPPPPAQPPTGVHEAAGLVYEDVDGNGAYDMFAGELGLAGWTIQLYWNGELINTATSDADGRYVFPGLGNGDQLWWVCVIPQAGYVRTQPVSGTACSGNGVAHSLNSPFMTRLETNFGEMIQ